MSMSVSLRKDFADLILCLPSPLTDPVAQTPVRKMVQMAPRRTAVIMLGLFAVLASFQTATASTSDLPCGPETAACLADPDCGPCLQTLQAIDINLDVEYTECSELYAAVSLSM